MVDRPWPRRGGRPRPTVPNSDGEVVRIVSSGSIGVWRRLVVSVDPARQLSGVVLAQFGWKKRVGHVLIGDRPQEPADGRGTDRGGVREGGGRPGAAVVLGPCHGAAGGGAVESGP